MQDMIGRRVRSWRGETGTVIKWEPLGAGMCDCLVAQNDGHEVWHSSTSLRPIDDKGALPSRRTAQVQADVQALASLWSIRADHVAKFHEPWPSCEHGKAIIGQALDGAIAEVQRRHK
jgi:hypothetical protein